MFPGDKDGRCVGLTTLLLSCADCLEIWESQLPVRAYNGIALVYLFCSGTGQSFLPLPSSFFLQLLPFIISVFAK